MKAKAIAVIALVVLLLVAAVTLYRSGGSEPRAEVRELKTQAKAVAASVEISRTTAEKVEVQGAETRQQTAAAQEKIHARIANVPRPARPASADVPGDLDGGADPVVLHLAREAHHRAICATCRVQRTSDCPPPSDCP
ncbi:hypothetical protein QLQ15_17750 [Lysobacter sp. LF1]|uniref:DUF2570 domain-containing protein n=1 Tax=Lysobacter stagni TaxID=3045172 RepID=A0ABT6XL35_9GAMM|nr:hypothetical protein [Lysobacter sp. LF1]MDI9240751.1 hypothetical protein [Lysobacter sp. LF1]